jgi:hypothetical protein
MNFRKKESKMKNNTGMIKAVSTLLILTFFTACATQPDKIPASYVSPLQYQGYTCDQIDLELTRVTNKVSEVTGQQQKEADKDAVAMGVGLFLFWPALFFLIGEDKKEELARLKGEYQALQDIAKQKECKKEEIKVVSIPQDIHIDRVSLRTKPIMELSEFSIKRMVAKYNFFDSSINISGSFDNYFVDNNDGTVTDMATMLTWQKRGSIIPLDNVLANTYIKQLNKELYAGYFDWRLPTLEELLSLLEKGEQKGVHIDPVFDNKQIRCWTVDRYKKALSSVGIGQTPTTSWLVNFKDGKISEAEWTKGSGGGGNIRLNDRNYTKAVRSAK